MGKSMKNAAATAVILTCALTSTATSLQQRLHSRGSLDRTGAKEGVISLREAIPRSEDSAFKERSPEISKALQEEGWFDEDGYESAESDDEDGELSELMSDPMHRLLLDLQEGAYEGYDTLGPAFTIPSQESGGSYEANVPRKRVKFVRWADLAEEVRPLEEVWEIESCLDKSLWDIVSAKGRKMLDPTTTEGSWAVGTTLWYAMMLALWNLHSQMEITG